MNLPEQIKADEQALGMSHILNLTEPEDWVEEIEIVEMSAYRNRILAQNGHKVTYDYGELNWLAEALGLPVDSIGGSNGK
jgi:hypothetical protein